MKNYYKILYTVLLLGTLAASVTYTACKKDECADTFCLNGGTCADGICKCPDGYEGETCEKTYREKFLGDWKSTDQCSHQSGANDIRIIENGEDQFIITVMNGYNNVIGRLAGPDRIYIGSQNLFQSSSSGGAPMQNVRGTLTMKNSKLEFSDTFTSTLYYGPGSPSQTTTSSCIRDYSKQ